MKWLFEWFYNWFKPSGGKPEVIDIGFPQRPQSPGELKRDGIPNPKRTRISKKKRLAMEEKIEEILDFAESFRWKKRMKAVGAKGFKLELFNGAEPLELSDDSEMNSILRTNNEDEGDLFLPPQYMHPAHVPDNWNCVFLHRGNDLLTTLSKFSGVKAKTIRGNAGNPSKHNCLAQTLVLVGKKVFFHKSYYGFVNGRWLRNGMKNRMLNKFDFDDHERIQMAISFAFVRQFQWSVSIGYENGINLNFITDPVGALNAFRLRELPENKSRRSPLKHWVSQHHRKTGNITPKKESEIRQHLRGQEHFTWNGLSVSINVCPWDIELALRLKKEKQDEIYNSEIPDKINIIYEPKIRKRTNKSGDISIGERSDEIHNKYNIANNGGGKVRRKLKARFHTKTGAKL